MALTNKLLRKKPGAPGSMPFGRGKKSATAKKAKTTPFAPPGTEIESPAEDKSKNEEKD